MTDQSAQEQHSNSVGAVGPGQQLRRAREARQLTIEEAASDLRLPARHLDALEREDLSSLPEPSYVCGYLRSYAKYLDLAASDVVENFPGVREYLASVKSTLMPTKLAVPRAEHVDAPRRDWLGIGLLVVALAVGGWLIAQFGGWFNREQPVATSAEQPTTAEHSTTETANSNVMVVDESESAGTNVAQTPAAESSDAPVEPVTQVAPATPFSELVVELSGDSWVEIYDSDQRRLAYQLGRGGNTITVKGPAPFKLILGMTANVHLQYNGAAVDMTRIQQRDAGLFRIGQAKDNRVESGVN